MASFQINKVLERLMFNLKRGNNSYIMASFQINRVCERLMLNAK
jgi:hypothetical protein